jgi:type II secretory pathway pseudopilin PulG
MTNTYFNFRNFLIISCLLPLNIGSSAIAQQSPKPTPTQAQNPASINSSASRFVGQWRLKDYLPIPLTVVFTQDGKLFVLLPSYLTSFLSSGSPSLSKGSVSAFEYRYKINSTAQPMQIDLISPAENETVATIFEFTSDGQLRVEWEGINPGEPRPTEFTAGAIYLQKVANTTALPRNTQIIDLAAQQRQARESEGQQYISSMNSAQQAFYIENEKFATAIDELGLGLKPETENYSYQIVPQSGSIPSAMMTAKAKSPELKSYTGAVFAIKVNGEVTSVSVVCRTDQPSTTPPAMPIAPKNAEEEIKCPAGSTAAE